MVPLDQQREPQINYDFSSALMRPFRIAYDDGHDGRCQETVPQKENPAVRGGAARRKFQCPRGFEIGALILSSWLRATF